MSGRITPIFPSAAASPPPVLEPEPEPESEPPQAAVSRRVAALAAIRAV